MAIPAITPDLAGGNPAAQKPPGADRPVELARVPTVPFAVVDERVNPAIHGCSVKTIQRERHEGVRC